MGMERAPREGALDAEQSALAELDALRARAYGVDADIADDAEALARLSELEAWHAHEMMGQNGASGLRETERERARENETAADAGASDAGGAPADAAAGAAPSAAQASAEPIPPGVIRRLPAIRVGAMAVGALAVVAAGLAVAGTLAAMAPRPDAVLGPIGNGPSEQVLRLADHARSLLVDESTLTAFERYRGLEVWAADSALGNRCLLIIEPSSDRLLAAGCVPEPAAPAVEIYDVPVYQGDDWHAGLPVGTVMRFSARGDDALDAVDVWVLEPVVP